MDRAAEPHFGTLPKALTKKVSWLCPMGAPPTTALTSLPQSTPSSGSVGTWDTMLRSKICGTGTVETHQESWLSYLTDMVLSILGLYAISPSSCYISVSQHIPSTYFVLEILRSTYMLHVTDAGTDPQAPQSPVLMVPTGPSHNGRAQQALPDLFDRRSSPS